LAALAALAASRGCAACAGAARIKAPAHKAHAESLVVLACKLNGSVMTSCPGE
jgi:hypothetical protein